MIKKIKKVLKTNTQSLVTVGTWTILKGEHNGGFCYSEKTLRSGVSRTLRREVTGKEKWPQKRKCESLEDRLHIFVLGCL